MMRGLVEEAGVFRTRSVGVVDQKGNILHFGTLPDYVPDSVIKLLDWAEHSTVHMLIRSCGFHLESISVCHSRPMRPLPSAKGWMISNS